MNARNYFLFLIFFVFTGCLNLSTKHLAGPYYMMYSEGSGEMALFFNDNNGSIFSTVVSAKVYEVAWNENLILVKQHPMELDENAQGKIFNNITGAERQKENMESSDRDLHDSLNQVIEENLSHLNNNRPLEDTTFYYLIDIKTQVKKRLLFDANSDCDSLIKVLRLTNSKKYHSLF